MNLVIKFQLNRIWPCFGSLKSRAPHLRSTLGFGGHLAGKQDVCVTRTDRLYDLLNSMVFTELRSNIGSHRKRRNCFFRWLTFSRARIPLYFWHFECRCRETGKFSKEIPARRGRSQLSVTIRGDARCSDFKLDLGEEKCIYESIARLRKQSQAVSMPPRWNIYAVLPGNRRGSVYIKY